MTDQPVRDHPLSQERPYRVRVLCEHCDEVITVPVPRVGEDMAPSALEAFGRAILEARLLHAVLECAVLLHGDPE